MENATRWASLADEASVIRAAQKGDRDAFEQLVRSCDHSVLRLAMNLLRNAEDARDVYQETFLRVYKNIRAFRFDCSLHTWLYRIVTNLCLDQLRRRRVRRDKSGYPETEDGVPDLIQAAPDERGDADPQRALMSRQLRERIEAALGELTPKERVAFELRHYHGMRLKEIGDVLGTTEEAAKNCLFRATRKLRVALGDFL